MFLKNSLFSLEPIVLRSLTWIMTHLKAFNKKMLKLRKECEIYLTSVDIAEAEKA